MVRLAPRDPGRGHRSAPAGTIRPRHPGLDPGSSMGRCQEQRCLTVDCGQSLHGIRITLDEPDQQGRLRIGPSPTLLPILQGAWVRSQVPSKNGTRQVQPRAQRDELIGGHFGDRQPLHLVRAQCAFACPLLGQGFEASCDLREQVPFSSSCLQFPLQSGGHSRAV